MHDMLTTGGPFSYIPFSLPKEPRHGWPTVLECALGKIAKSLTLKKAFRRASQSERDKRNNIRYTVYARRN